MASKGQQKSHRKLGELSATAICGNDITSSCLYVSALATMAAAHLSPISLLIVAAVLFLFRKIYAEVVGALPLNGGAYNALLNTTSKSRASMAACLTTGEGPKSGAPIVKFTGSVIDSANAQIDRIPDASTVLHLSDM